MARRTVLSHYSMHYCQLSVPLLKLCRLISVKRAVGEPIKIEEIVMVMIKTKTLHVIYIIILLN